MKKTINRNQLPAFSGFSVPQTQSRIDMDIYSRWNPNLKAAKDENNMVTIYEVIGEDFWTGGGFTAKRMEAALRSIGKKNDVVVSVNSPGGDFFEGAAIYNLLREHEGKVTVKVIGLAASAASIIAMAGDTIQIADLGFIMIHNSWGMVVGNQNDFIKAADTFAKFDEAAVGVYAARSGYDSKKIAKMMDNDTWLTAAEAIEKGFADERMSEEPGDDQDNDDKKNQARAKRAMEMAMARCGITRKEREDLFAKAFGKRDAADDSARDAAGAECGEEGLKSLLTIIKGG